MKDAKKNQDEFTPEAAASVFNSCIRFCDVIITGKEAAIGLKYDEENMFAPMVVFLEKGPLADALVWAAENLGVPVIKNIALAKNLVSHCKAGDAITEATYRDVSLTLVKLDSNRFQRKPPASGNGRQGLPVKIPRSLSLEMGSSLFALTGEEPGRDKLLAQPLNAMRKRLIRLLGISLPAFRISRSAKLKDDEYRILFKGLEAGRGRLELGWYSKSTLAYPESTFAYDAVIPEIMVRPENISSAAKFAASSLLRHAEEIIEQRVPELLGRDEVEAILDAAEEQYPVVTGEVKGFLSLGIIREILQGLVSERVSIRHIAVILETLADWGSFGPVPSDLIIERIRQSLKRQICMEYTDDRLTLRVLTLDSKLEKKIADLSQDSPLLEDWTEAITGAARGMKERGLPPVILCSPKARFPVKEATRKQLPELAVLSYLEIPSDIIVEPVGEIVSDNKTGEFRIRSRE
jgi:flagellar biosynthesis component FlhA/type III secretion system FlhB-like substrate exporter